MSGEGFGRPLKFKSVEELEEKIEGYFKWADSNPIEKIHPSQLVDSDKLNPLTKKPIREPLKYNIQRPYTIEGLCVHLDCDRNTLLNYSKKENKDFFRTIARAKSKILQQKMELGLTQSASERITEFDLTNNFKYTTKHELDLKGSHTLNWGDDNKSSD